MADPLSQDDINKLVDSFRRMLTEVEQNNTSLGKQTTGIKKSTKAYGSFTSELQRSTDSIVKGTGSLFSSLNASKTSFDSMFSSISSITLGSKNLISALSKPVLKKGFMNFEKTLPKLNSILGMGSAAFGGIVMTAASMLGFFVGQLQQSLEAHQQATSAGASFGGSLLGLKKTATEAGMSVSEFAGFIKSANTRLAAFAGSVTTGAKMTASLAGSIINSNLFEEFRALGMGVREVNEAALAQLELQASNRRLDKFNALAESDKIKETLKYVKSLKVLGELTGDSVEEQMKKRDELRSIAMFRRVLDDIAINVGPRTAENLGNAAKLFDKHSKEAGQLFRELAAEGKPLNEITALMTQRFPALATTMANTIGMIHAGGESLDTKTFSQRMVDILKVNKDAMEEDRKNNREFMRVSAFDSADSMVKAMADAAVRHTDFLIKLNGDVRKELLDERTKLDLAAQQSASTIDQLTRQFRTFTDEILGSNGFSSLVKEFGDFLKDTAIPFFKNDLIPGLKTLMKYLGSESKVESFNKNKEDFKTGGFLKFEDFRDMQIDFEKAMKSGKISNEKLLEMQKTIEQAEKSLSMWDKVMLGARNIVSSPYDMFSRDSTLEVEIMKDKLKKTNEDKNIPEFKDGGISKGPKSGYNAKLHGTEGIIPLPDGKKIPVVMDQSDLIKTMNEMNSTLKEIQKNTRDMNDTFLQSM